MILFIDNFDSFTYNIVGIIGGIHPDLRVVRNNAVTIDQIAAMKPSHIILSPGPGRPTDAGVCTDVVRECQGKIPILGICLGHQVICETLGGTVGYAKTLMHGKVSRVTLDATCPLFAGLPASVNAGRYHSLAATVVPDCLAVTAQSDDGEVMAVAHKTAAVYGVQFHPESVLTERGETILKNFLEVTI